VLATVPDSQFSYSSGSDPELDCCNTFYHTRTWTIAIGLVLQPKTSRFNDTDLAPMKALSSDDIVTWPICRSCSLAVLLPPGVRFTIRPIFAEFLSKTGEFQITFGIFFTWIQLILVASQIWNQEVNERPKLHTLRIGHVTIQSELKILITAEVVGMVKWTHSKVPKLPKTRGFRSSPGYQSVIITQSGSSAGPNPHRGPRWSCNLDHSWVTWNSCQHLL